jgi:hypothetical protein
VARQGIPLPYFTCLSNKDFCLIRKILMRKGNVIEPQEISEIFPGHDFLVAINVLLWYGYVTLHTYRQSYRSETLYFLRKIRYLDLLKRPELVNQLFEFGLDPSEVIEKLKSEEL